MNPAEKERSNILAYLSSIGSNPDIANYIINSQFVNVIMRVSLGFITQVAAAPTKSAKENGIPSVSLSQRVAAMTLLALLIRHASIIRPRACVYIHSKTEEIPVVRVLCSVITNHYKQSTQGMTTDGRVLARRAMAALGELLFFISTQPNVSLVDGSDWGIPTDSLVRAFESCMNDDSDYITQHYAMKVWLTASTGILYKFYV